MAGPAPTERQIDDDVALLMVDLAMGDVDPIDFLRRSAARWPRLPMLALSARGEDDRLIASIRAGARGCLFLDDATARVGSAVREALAGGRPTSRGMAQLLVEHIRRSARPPSRERPALRPVTERERAVLQQMARGYTYDDIGRSLGVSVNTVRGFVRALYRKLDVNSRTEAVLLAMQLGLVKGTPYPGLPKRL